MNLTLHALTPDRWPDLEALFARGTETDPVMRDDYLVMSLDITCYLMLTRVYDGYRTA
ncbi:MAG: hypothetical protein WEE64_11040 [Dehalococcoidia bacterium]